MVRSRIQFFGMTRRFLLLTGLRRRPPAVLGSLVIASSNLEGSAIKTDVGLSAFPSDQRKDGGLVRRLLANNPRQQQLAGVLALEHRVCVGARAPKVIRRKCSRVRPTLADRTTYPARFSRVASGYTTRLERQDLVESECGAVAVGRTYLLPPLSSDGASLVRPWLRFHTPLIEPDMQISRIRLSDKTSRLHPRRAATKLC
jgi:hypothetical protein